MFLLKTHRRDRACLRHHLAENNQTCCLLRTRMEELINFLEEMLSVTPPQGHRSTRHELMASHLNQTRELLAEVAAKHADYGML